MAMERSNLFDFSYAEKRNKSSTPGKKESTNTPTTTATPKRPRPRKLVDEEGPRNSPNTLISRRSPRISENRKDLEELYGAQPSAELNSDTVSNSESSTNVTQGSHSGSNPPPAKSSDKKMANPDALIIADAIIVEASSGQEVIVPVVDVETPMEGKEETQEAPGPATAPRRPPNCGNEAVSAIRRMKDKLGQLAGSLKATNEIAQRESEELENFKKKAETLDRMTLGKLALRVGDLIAKTCGTDARINVLESKANKAEADFELLKAEVELLKNNEEVLNYTVLKDAQTQTEPAQSGSQSDAEVQTLTENETETTEKSANPPPSTSASSPPLSLAPPQENQQVESQGQVHGKSPYLCPGPPPAVVLVPNPLDSTSTPPGPLESETPTPINTEVRDETQEQQCRDETEIDPSQTQSQGETEIQDSADTSETESQPAPGEQHAPMIQTPTSAAKKNGSKVTKARPRKGIRYSSLNLKRRLNLTADEAKDVTVENSASVEFQLGEGEVLDRSLPPASTKRKRTRKSELAKLLETVGAEGAKVGEGHSPPQPPSQMEPSEPASPSARPKRKRNLWSAISYTPHITTASDSGGAGKLENLNAGPTQDPPPPKKSKGKGTVVKGTLTSDLGGDKQMEIDPDTKPLSKVKVSRKKSTRIGTPSKPKTMSSKAGNGKADPLGKAAIPGRKKRRPLFQGRRKRTAKIKTTPGTKSQNNQEEAAAAEKDFSKDDDVGSKGTTSSSVQDQAPPADEIDVVPGGSGSSQMELGDGEEFAASSQVASQASGKGQREYKKGPSAAARSSKRLSESNCLDPESPIQDSAPPDKDQEYPGSVGQVKGQDHDEGSESVSVGNEEGQGQAQDGTIRTDELYDLMEDDEDSHSSVVFENEYNSVRRNFISEYNSMFNVDRNTVESSDAESLLDI